MSKKRNKRDTKDTKVSLAQNIHFPHFFIKNCAFSNNMI